MHSIILGKKKKKTHAKAVEAVPMVTLETQSALLQNGRLVDWCDHLENERKKRGKKIV